MLFKRAGKTNDVRKKRRKKKENCRERGVARLGQVSPPNAVARSRQGGQRLWQPCREAESLLDTNGVKLERRTDRPATPLQTLRSATAPPSGTQRYRSTRYRRHAVSESNSCRNSPSKLRPLVSSSSKVSCRERNV